MATDFYTALKTRRTVYTLTTTSTIPDERIQEILTDAIKHVPSPFNSQSARVVLLLGNAHSGLWNHAKDVLRGIVKDPAAFADTEKRVDGFRNAHGTVLFFEDQEVVRELEEKFSLYKDNFQPWSNHSSGMLQFAVWTSLAIEGLGASLQHYSPLVDNWVYDRTGAPRTWKLIAQMPFGTPSAPAGAKEFSPVETRFKVVR